MHHLSTLALAALLCAAHPALAGGRQGPVQEFDFVDPQGLTYQVRIPEGYDLVRHQEIAPGYDQCMGAARVRYDSKACFDQAMEYLNARLREGMARAKKACPSRDCQNSLVQLQKDWLAHGKSAGDFLQKYVAIYGYTSEMPMEFALEETLQQVRLLEAIAGHLEDFAR